MTQAVRGCARIVVADARRRPDAPLSRVVGPRAAHLRRVIDGFVHQQYLTGQPCRPGDRLQHVGEPVVVAVPRRLAEIAVVEVEFVIEVDRRVGPAARDRRLAPPRRVAVAAVAQHRVPDRLEAVLRRRERNASLRARDAVAAGRELRRARIGRRFRVHGLRERRAAPRRIDVHPPRRVLLQQRDLAGRELFPVLLDVGGADREQRLVVPVGIRVGSPASVSGDRLHEATLPGRYGPSRVAGGLGTERSPVLCGHRRRATQRDDQRNDADARPRRRRRPHAARVAFRTHS